MGEDVQLAKTYPSEFPEHLIVDRAPEKRVYDALGGLPDGFTVIYSLSWHEGRREQNPTDGEADFVVIDPARGLLFLEVKGGTVAYQGGRWLRTHERGDATTLGIDPIQQALRSQKWFERQIADESEWTLLSGELAVGHAVVFPDVRAGQRRLKPDLPRELVVDFEDLRSPEQSVDRLFRHFSGPGSSTRGIDGHHMSVAKRILLPEWELRTPLGRKIDEAGERIIELTEQQFQILDFLADRKRVLIEGCAGSGKTMIALELCRRSAKDGQDVLLVCFNKLLSSHLAHAFPEGVVSTFHQLCLDLCGLESPRQTNSEYWKEELPNAALDKASESGQRFDLIVVDEGQDFRDSWWLVLESLARDENDSRLFVFRDNNQNIYQRSQSLPDFVEEAPYTLSRNLRNTKQIHELVRAFHSDPSAIMCDGPEGEQVEVGFYRGENRLHRKIGKELKRLVKEESVACGDIAVLTPLKGKSSLSEGDRAGDFTLTWETPKGTNDIQLHTIYRFKGLEKPVVILAEIDLRDRPDLEELMYVASSRANALLVVLLDADSSVDFSEMLGRAGLTV